MKVENIGESEVESVMKLLAFLALAGCAFAQTQGPLTLDPKQMCDWTLKMGSSTRAIKDVFPEECGKTSKCCVTGTLKLPATEMLPYNHGDGAGAEGFVESLDEPLSRYVEQNCHIERDQRAPIWPEQMGKMNMPDGWVKAGDLRIVCRKPQSK